MKPNLDGHQIELRVRYAECDSFGYLHHAKYWEYFECARTELLRARGFRYRDLEAEGVYFVVYKTACRYLRPIRYDEELVVSVRVGRLTATRVDHLYEIHRAGELTTEATATLACVDREGRPRVMPEVIWQASK